MNDQPNTDQANVPTAEIPAPDIAQSPAEVEKAGLLAALQDLREKNRTMTERWEAHEAEQAERARAEEDAQKTWEQRYQDLETKFSDLSKWAEDRRAADAAELETLAAANAAAIELLTPEQKLNPALKSDDPKAVAAAIAWMRDIGVGGKKAIGGVQRPAAVGASGLTPEERAFAEADRMLAGLLEEGTLRPETVRRVMAASKR